MQTCADHIHWGGGDWTTVDPHDMLAGTGTESLDELFNAFVTGPITPATLEHATVTDMVQDTVDYGEVCNTVALVAPIWFEKSRACCVG